MELNIPYLGFLARSSIRADFENLHGLRFRVWACRYPRVLLDHALQAIASSFGLDALDALA